MEPLHFTAFSIGECFECHANDIQVANGAAPSTARRGRGLNDLKLVIFGFLSQWHNYHTCLTCQMMCLCPLYMFSGQKWTPQA